MLTALLIAALSTAQAAGYYTTDLGTRGMARTLKTHPRPSSHTYRSCYMFCMPHCAQHVVLKRRFIKEKDKIGIEAWIDNL